MTQKAVSIVRDSKGRILAEIYPSTEKKEPCFRYRIIGGNGEKWILHRKDMDQFVMHIED